MIVIDVEATGVVYHKHSIISIGAIDFENPDRQFYEECRIWDGAEINDQSLAITGFSREEVTDPQRKTEGEIVRAFLAWTTETHNRTLAGQNVSFDRDYIKAAAEREGLDYDLAHRTIDTHTLAYMHHVKRDLPIPIEKNRTGLNLEYVARYCGIPEEPEPHNAFTGAMVHAEVIARLLYDKKLLPEFQDHEIPW